MKYYIQTIGLCLLGVACSDGDKDPSYSGEFITLKEEVAVKKVEMQQLEKQIEEKDELIDEINEKVAELEEKLQEQKNSPAKVDVGLIHAGLSEHLPSLKKKVLQSHSGGEMYAQPKFEFSPLDVEYPISVPMTFFVSAGGQKIEERWVGYGNLEGKWRFEKAATVNRSEMDRIAEVKLQEEKEKARGAELARIEAAEEARRREIARRKAEEEAAKQAEWPPKLPAPWRLMRHDDNFATYINSETGVYKIEQRK